MAHHDAYALKALEQFDQHFKAEGGFRPGPECLPDGEYDCEIISAILERTKNSGEPIVRMSIRVVSGPKAGTVFDRGSLLGKQESADRFGAELVTLGIDADKWTEAAGRKFTQELPGALDRLAGRKFSAKKSTSDQTDKNGRPYQNFNITSLLSGKAMPSRAAAVAASDIPF
jgi:hypothetical protein